jgi:Helix-turn-helix domain
MPGYSKTSQLGQLLHHLRHFGSITTLFAFEQYKICRLAARIAELEADGFLINHTRVQKRGRSYVAYSLVEGRTRKAA